MPAADNGYLAQSDMRELIQHALDLGWTLFAYEADIARSPIEIVAKGTTTREFTNWRELERRHQVVHISIHKTISAGKPNSSGMSTPTAQARRPTVCKASHAPIKDFHHRPFRLGSRSAVSCMPASLPREGLTGLWAGCAERHFCADRNGRRYGPKAEDTLDR